MDITEHDGEFWVTLPDGRRLGYATRGEAEDAVRQAQADAPPAPARSQPRTDTGGEAFGLPNT